jgi:HEAT repeat protein
MARPSRMSPPRNDEFRVLRVARSARGKLGRTLITVLVGIIFWGGTCPAQAPPTTEAELRKYGIPTTRAALQSALRDDRPEVRSLAAGELTSMKDTASTTLIVKAIEAEKDPVVQFNMAASLLSLEPQVGRQFLSKICRDASLPDERRLDAASRLVNVGDIDCLPFLETILGGAANHSDKASALLTLARIRPVPGSLLPRIHTALLASLRDRDPAVREYAGRCIAALGDKAATADLRAAIARESDQSVLERMKDSLKGLEDSH